MANINDYLQSQGDVELSKNSGFNEVDQLVLARFSYLPFEKITLNKIETIRTIAEKMSELNSLYF